MEEYIRISKLESMDVSLDMLRRTSNISNPAASEQVSSRNVVLKLMKKIDALKPLRRKEFWAT